MPDKNTDWTPDEAFWDDAWADMEKRLDRRRRRPLWLWLPLLLLLLAGGGALVQWSFPEAGEGATQVAHSPAPHVETPSVARAELATEGRGGEALLSPTASPPAASGPAESATGTGATSPAAPPRPDPAPASAPTAAAAPALRDLLTASPPVATLPILPLPTAFTLPIAVVAPTNAPVARTKVGFRPVVGVGLTTYPVGYRPGAYASAGILLQRGGRWFVPLTMRVDRGVRELTPRTAEDLYARTQSNGGAAYLMDLRRNAGAVGEIAETVPVVTHTLALRTGVGRRYGRFSFALGGDVSYLLGGRGPQFDYSPADRLLSISDARFRDNGFDGGPGRSIDYATPNLNVGYADGQFSPNTSLNRWQLNAWANADYRLRSQLSITLGLTRHLTPLYQDSQLEVAATRVELGMRYGF